MKFNFAGKIRVGYFTAFILLLISYLLTFYTNWQLAKQNKLVDHTNKMINNLEFLLSNVKDAETGYRGYIITEDDKFLGDFYPSHHKADSVYRLLERLARDSSNSYDNSLQQARLKDLHAFIEAKFAIINAGVEDYREAGLVITDSIRQHGYEAKRIMDSVRFITGLMQHREQEYMQSRTKDVKKSATAIKIINLSSLVIAILVASYSVITFNVENKAKDNAARKAEEYRKSLEERVEELKKLNQELTSLRSMEKFATTGRLARTIAHEIRNPLTNIGLAAEQLKGEIESNEDASMLFDMINRNGARINQLITDLLNSTKFSELKYELVSVNEVLEDALMLADDRIHLKKVQIRKDYDDDICELLVDEDKLRIAFLNIVVNAIEAMPDDSGLLKIKTRGRDGKCVVTITDNGFGMDQETLSRLFEPYFTRKSKGNGLGLTNTQNVILNHKGSIEVESELGKGTSFIITLMFPDGAPKQ